MTRSKILVLALVPLAFATIIDAVAVISKPSSRMVDLPGEFQPFLGVSLRAKVAGFVDKVLVDRGSVVKEGQLLIELSAPELAAQIAEAESKVQAEQAGRAQAEAQRAGAQSTYEKLKLAAATPGAVAGNELIQADNQWQAAKAAVAAREQSVRAAQSALGARKDLQAYLKITAPFDGVVTERLVHPGALAGGNADAALLVIQQVSRLRLTVAVPEESAGGIVRGAKVDFRVPAYPDRVFSGTIARSSHSLDSKTRTMAVEMDVANHDGVLSPGMYASVKWPVRRTTASLFVPKTSVVTTAERTFVIRAKAGHAEWVDVKKGAADGDLIEVVGALHAGDMVLRRPTDEIRDGGPLVLH